LFTLCECPSSQEADGYLGGFAPEARWRNWLETYSLAHALNAAFEHGFNPRGSLSGYLLIRQHLSIMDEILSKITHVIGKAPLLLYRSLVMIFVV